MSKQLTIRGVSDEIGQRLIAISREQGKSVNTVVLEILKAAVGVDERKQRLQRYTTWTEDDLTEFESALDAQRVIDEELWK
jgi:plasmid stability protein